MLNKILFALSLFASLAFNLQAQVQINLDKIAMIESSNNPKAIGDGGKSLGKYQIKSQTVQDFNKCHSVKYTHKDMLNPQIAKQVASWYMHHKIPQYLKAKKLEVTEKRIIECYNRGPNKVGKLPLPKVTENYFKKYFAKN